MKKRLLSLTLILTILFSLFALRAEGESVGENITSISETCPCGCGSTLSKVQWKAYNVNEDGSLAPGHYYLEDDYAQTGSQQVIMSGNRIVIDLRGHTLTTAYNGRLFLIYGNLYVLDTAGGGQMMSKTSGSGYGGVVMMSINETNSSLFELHSGTLTVDAEGKSSLRGGIISVGQSSTFRMFGGVITGGTTVASDTLYSQGGALAGIMSSATIEILGGTIMNCSSASDGGSIYNIGTTILRNCRILGGTAQGNGGNIYQGGGSLIMDNCEIAYGTAHGTTGGGNIYVNKATVTDSASTIRDGYAAGNTGSSGGGNLFVGTGTQTFVGTTIRGGVSNRYGANVLNWSSDAKTKLQNCSIDGDVRWAGNGLTLAGKTKIGLRGNGLNLVGGSAGSVVSGSGLTAGAEIFVSARWGVFTNDKVNSDYFKPALRTIITQQSDGKLSGSLAASGKEGGYCPHCYDPQNPKTVSWTAFGSGVFMEGTTDEIPAGHYYLSKSVTGSYVLNQASQDVVIDINGVNITGNGRAFSVTNGASLSLVDFNGAGSVTGTGGVTTATDGEVTKLSGGVIYCSNGTLNIYGSRFVFQSDTDTDQAIHYGGVIYAENCSNVNIYGGRLDGGAFHATSATNQGGAIYLDATANTFTMTAGRIMGGHAYRGGAMSFNAGNTVSMTGAVISGGTATNGGGNLRFYGSNTTACNLTMSQCAVMGGTVIGDDAGITSSSRTYYGGNIQYTYAEARMDDCYVLDGSCTAVSSYGGNFSFGSGNVQVSNSIITSGKAPKGGNIYISAVTSNAKLINTLLTRGEAIIPSGSTSSSDGCGGNVFANNGLMMVNGGEISFGIAKRSGGNLYLHPGNLNVQSYPAAADDKVVLAAAEEGDTPLVLAGRAEVSGGNIYTDAVLDLASAYIHGGQAATSGDDLYLHKGTNTKLTAGEDLVGYIRMATAPSLLGSTVYGEAINATSAGTMNAKIVLENAVGEPQILSVGGKLFVSVAAVIDSQGNTGWYSTNANAVKACSDDQFVKLYTDSELKLTKDLTVDLNGHQVMVSGNYILSGMDSSGDDYTEGTGKAIWASDSSVKSAGITYAPNGNKYVALTDGAAVAYHRLSMEITDVALRTNVAGLYYKAQWNCSDTLKTQIKEYGLVVSLEDMPDSNFRDTSEYGENRWVSYDGAALTKDEKRCGDIVTAIFRDTDSAADNQTRGEMPVYATAYVTLANGSTFVSDAPGTEDDVNYSLYRYLQYVDSLIKEDPTNFRQLEKTLKEFYGKWESKGCGNWKFDRIKTPVDPATDDELNFLIFSSSSGYYWVEELQAMLTNAGYKNVRVCNLYYSGCRFQWHYEWWRDGKSNYQLFVTDDTGRHMTEGVSLEYGLSQYNWDFIGTLETSSYIRYSSNDAQKHYDKIKKYLDAVIPYVQSEFPLAKMYYQEGWANQIGYDGNGYQINSVADQEHDMSLYRGLSSLICPTYGLERVNLGEAWQEYRAVANASAADGLEDTLCARLGKTVSGAPHEGDFAHDGDIGGGQLLNACVWYEILTGLDCRENDYSPTYSYGGKTFTLSEELVTALKEAAHKAVSKRSG